MTSPTQGEMPFYETAEDATYSAILRSGKRPKEVALSLWPNMKADSAYARLMGALKLTRPEKLTADDHLFIANYLGQFDFLHYCAAECHHSRPDPVSPEDEAADLQRQFIASTDQLLVMANRIKALNGGGR